MMRWMATFVDHLLLSLIAFSRFILLKSPSLGKRLFDGRAATVSLLIVWLLGVTAVLPNAFGVRNYDHEVKLFRPHCHFAQF